MRASVEKSGDGILPAPSPLDHVAPDSDLHWNGKSSLVIVDLIWYNAGKEAGHHEKSRTFMLMFTVTPWSIFDRCLTVRHRRSRGSVLAARWRHVWWCHLTALVRSFSSPMHSWRMVATISAAPLTLAHRSLSSFNSKWNVSTDFNIYVTWITFHDRNHQLQISKALL